ncbi:MAG TPA: DUF1214 domain-containing protein [Xanthobacteraceae bacterium]|jgi:hypothetical protein|nr:DUF1214 domain-containing protein [Xanthobacteraceae bacterium]
MKRLTFAAATWLAAVAPLEAQPIRISDSDILEAYQYMLARWLVLRQEAQDLKDGFKWNEIIHREPTGLNGPYPMPDIVISEAWIAVDETSCTIIDLPEFKDRYYTVQIMNGWGQVTANLNERNYKKHPYGRFALCLKDAKIVLPKDPPPPRQPRAQVVAQQPAPKGAQTQTQKVAQAQPQKGAQPQRAAAPPRPAVRPPILRVDLPNKKSRLIVRIALAGETAEAVALQKQITLRATGTPKVDKAVVEFNFTGKKLPGVEGFEKTEEILASEDDINSGTVVVRDLARNIAKTITDPSERARIDDVIQKRAIPKFMADLPNLGREMYGWRMSNNVGNFRTDYQMRAAVNYGNLWANSNRETVSYAMQGIDGSRIFTQTFPKDALPDSKTRYLWEVIMIDDAEHRIIKNPQNKHMFNDQSDLKSNDDGSLTLAFSPKPPAGVPESNWLPSPQGRRYTLLYRFYGPNSDVVGGTYYPPPLVRGK